MAWMQEFGWRQIELAVPGDWFLAAEGGGRDRGYFRLDDEAGPRLEVTWERIPFEKAPTPEEMLEKYRQNVEKRARKMRKKGARIPQPKTVQKRSAEVGGHEALQWTARSRDLIANLYFWYCEDSERGIILNMAFPLREADWEKTAKAVLRSVRCHFPPGRSILWSLYAAPIRLPPEYQPVAAKLTAGLSHITFKHAEKEIYVAVAYSGLARQLLARYKKGLKDWYKKGIHKEVVKKVLRVGRAKLRERDGSYTVEAKTLSLIPSRARVTRGRIWVHQAKNRIFAVIAHYEARHSQEAEALLEDLQKQLEQSPPRRRAERPGSRRN